MRCHLHPLWLQPDSFCACRYCAIYVVVVAISNMNNLFGSDTRLGEGCVKKSWMRFADPKFFCTPREIKMFADFRFSYISISIRQSADLVTLAQIG